MSATPRLPGDDELVAFVDGALPAERAAEVRALVEANPALRAEVERLRAMHARLAEAPPARPDVAVRVLERIDGRTSPRSSRALWVAAPVLAAAAVVFVVVRTDGERTARGAAVDAGERNVDLVVYVEERDVTRTLRDGDRVGARARLLVDVSALPAQGEPRAIAVFARDARGAVTWLRPAFTDASAPPPCEALPDDAALLRATRGVEVVAPPGPLAVHYVVLPPSRCDVARLDRDLEGLAPQHPPASMGALAGPRLEVR